MYENLPITYLQGELGFKLKNSAERMRSLFMEALQNCVDQVKKEGQ